MKHGEIRFSPVVRVSGECSFLVVFEMSAENLERLRNVGSAATYPIAGFDYSVKVGKWASGTFGLASSQIRSYASIFEVNWQLTSVSMEGDPDVSPSFYYGSYGFTLDFQVNSGFAELDLISSIFSVFLGCHFKGIGEGKIFLEKVGIDPITNFAQFDIVSENR